MKHLILIIAFTTILNSCKNSTGGNSDSKELQDRTSDYEIKKKELELKEKELDLKEKEMEFNAKLKRIPPEEVKVFIENWANVQTNKALDSYTSLYSSEFQGIKKTKTGKTTFYNYSEWINDRRKMYSSAKNLVLSAYDVKVVSFDPNTGNTKVQFTQFYSSENYQDEGLKVMELIRDHSGSIKILKEEMVYSGEVTEGC